MLVKNRMTLNPYTVTPETSIGEAYTIMRDHKFHRLPVVKNGKLVGIVTEKELQRVSPSEATTLSVFELNYLLTKMTVKDAMTKDVITVQDTELVENAAVLMRDKDIGALPVMRGDRLVGIITESDIFDAFIDIIGARSSGARLAVRVPDNPGVGGEVFTIIGKYDVNIQNVAYTRGREGAEFTFRLDTDDADVIKRAMIAKGFEIIEEGK
ncbi:MAG: CBS domain-containing protein [Oscillospiraceae bacterium]|nr:CBS domain-containing protein [Oscillospiraceae bacterium]